MVIKMILLKFILKRVIKYKVYTSQNKQIKKTSVIYISTFVAMDKVITTNNKQGYYYTCPI